LTRLRINGARGVTLLGFALVALVFGLAFNSPVAVIPPPPAGLRGLDSLIPLQVWGLFWYLAAGFLFVGAFRQNQAKSMMLFSGLLFIWGSAYATAAFTDSNPRMVSLFAMQSVIYGGLLTACMGVARLLNAPPIDIAALRKRVNCEKGEQGDVT
jgi:hypothetical protein